MIIDTKKIHIPRAFKDSRAEKCGYLDESLKIHPLQNISKNPKDSFKIDPIESANIDGTAIYIHTHPLGSKKVYGVSKKDLENSNGCSGVIVENEIYFYGSNTFYKNLLSRKFVYGVHDCYTLVRDYHFYNVGNVLPLEPRQMDEITGILEGFKEAYKVEEVSGALKEGDILLIDSLNRGLDHLGVVEKNTKIFYHHYLNQLSKRDTVAGYASKIKKAFRVSKEYNSTLENVYEIL